jgi:hypothetical protein
MNKGKKNKKIIDFFYRTIWEGGDEKKVPYQWKLGEKEEYIRICEAVKVWGGIPLDVPWASGTNSYQEAKGLLGEMKN